MGFSHFVLIYADCIIFEWEKKKKVFPFHDSAPKGEYFKKALKSKLKKKLQTFHAIASNKVIIKSALQIEWNMALELKFQTEKWLEHTILKPFPSINYADSHAIDRETHFIC